MSRDKNRYSEEFRIYSYEVDITNTATLQTICQYLQEVASNHAEELGFGVSWLLENQRTWMLSRLLVRMEQYPRVGDRIVVTTWPSGTERFYFLRDFLIQSVEGKLLGSAVSSWVYMNLETRRPVHPGSEEFSYDFSGSGERALPENPGKIKTADNMEKKTFFRVRYNDLDLNNHVNNIKYVEWLLESLDPEFRKTHFPAELSVNFLAEALYGHEVTVHRGEGDGLFSHLITNSDDKPVCRAETRWLAPADALST